MAGGAGSRTRRAVMTVAVIGTGNMGAGIARLLASKGERVDGR
jgi:3-hydroxyacyl-CoA dehydrogenase